MALWIPASTAATAALQCTTEHDCSLAGACSPNGTCVCDGWSHGDHCEVLNLLEVDPIRYGYRNSSGYNSWGGASIFDGEKWWLFASQMQGKCPLLTSWAAVSEVVRGVSDHPMGPFESVEVIIPSFAHNAKPFLAPDMANLLHRRAKQQDETLQRQWHRHKCSGC